MASTQPGCAALRCAALRCNGRLLALFSAAALQSVLARLCCIETHMPFRCRTLPPLLTPRSCVTTCVSLRQRGDLCSRLRHVPQAVCEDSHVGAAGGEVVRVGFAFLDAATDHFYLGELSDGYARRNLTTLLTQVMRKRAGPIFCSNTCLLGELIDVISFAHGSSRRLPKSMFCPARYLASLVPESERQGALLVDVDASFASSWNNLRPDQTKRSSGLRNIYLISPGAIGIPHQGTAMFTLDSALVKACCSEMAIEALQVAPAEILLPRNSLSKPTARLLGRPPLPAVLSSLTPGAEFPAPSQAGDMLAGLVGAARARRLPTGGDHRVSVWSNLRPSRRLAAFMWKTTWRLTRSLRQWRCPSDSEHARPRHCPTYSFVISRVRRTSVKFAR